MEAIQLTIDAPDEALLNSADNFRVDERKIATAAEYVAAGEELKAIKSAAHEIDAKRKELVKPLNDAKNDLQHGRVE